MLPLLLMVVVGVCDVPENKALSLPFQSTRQTLVG